MEKLVIEKTNSTPYVSLDAAAGLLRFRGESYPENVVKFYSPILKWLKEYLPGVSRAVTVEFEIVYFNSSSSKVFMTIFAMLEQAAQAGKRVTVKWRCDAQNETAIECGEEFKEDVGDLPFDIEVF